MNIYVNQYQIGYEIVESPRPSLQRYPISHGPFSSYEQAEQWAATNLDNDNDNN